MIVNPATYVLHVAMIRLAKGMITAWEVWLNSHDKQSKEIPPHQK